MKKVFAAILFLSISIVLALSIRFVFGGPEDVWICKNGQWQKHGNPPTPMPTLKCAEKIYQNDEYISWYEATQLISNCMVKSSFQSHSLAVTLTLKNGTNVKTTEPIIDEVFTIINNSNHRCGKIQMATE